MAWWADFCDSQSVDLFSIHRTSHRFTAPSFWILRSTSRFQRLSAFDFMSASKVIRNKPELFEGGLEVVHDFLGDDVGIGKVVGGFEALVLEPEDVEAGFVAGNKFVIVVGAPAAVWFLLGPRRFTLVAIGRVVALHKLVEVFALQRI